MKKALLLAAFLLCYTHHTAAQVLTQCNGVSNPSNNLWANFSQSASDPKKLPDPIPLSISYPGLVKKVIDPNFNSLKNALDDLVANNGGVISFKNVGSGKTILFDKAIPLSVPSARSCITILIEGNNNIKFDGKQKSSMFFIRGSIKVVVQNTVFQNAKLTRQIIEKKGENRVGGGAIEVTAGAALRAYNCTFLNNSVAEWDDAPGGGYTGVGENQNGAGIRFNYHTTGELFKSTFRNCRAVTGGAIGATSINKLTIMDCLFDKNIATSYNTKNSTKRRIPEGAGALRVDRTAKPLELYRTVFKENAANLKASVMEVFIRPLRDGSKETGPYPNLSTFAMIIDGCTFENNKYYNFQGASDPERGDFFGGNILFHGGKLDQNFRGAKMKITNSRFDSNEVGESNIRSFLDFELTNSIIANTKILRLKGKNNKFRIGKGAIALRGEIPNKGLINRCTFYKNEPHPQDPKNQGTASDIFFWKGLQDKYEVKNCIFFRETADILFRQVSLPLKGSGNNQFIPNLDMSTFPSVSTASVTTSNPNIQFRNSNDICLGNNFLPAKIGGLPSCGSTAPTPNPNPTPNPSTQLITDGSYFLESVTSNQRMIAEATANHTATMSTPNNKNSQHWVITHIRDNVYTIKNVVTNRFLEVPFAKCTNRTQVATYTKGTSKHQQWKIEANANNFSLKPAHCVSQALDRNNGTLNTNVHTYTFGSKNNNQKWKILPIPGSKRDGLLTKDANKVTIQPNPTSEFVTIGGTQLGDIIKIYALSGKLLLKKQAMENSTKIALTMIPKGIYIAAISDRAQIKFVID